jgi:exopolysaccharide biosynthesis polyprenyl glycosylphosphotransferase
VNSADPKAFEFGGRSASVNERTAEILRYRRGASPAKRRGWLIRRVLLVADLVGLVAAFLTVELAFGLNQPDPGSAGFESEILIFVLSLPGWALLMRSHGLYERDEERTEHSTADDLVGVFHVLTFGAWCFFALTWLTGVVEPQFEKILLFWTLAIVMVSVARASGRTLARRHVAYLQNTVIVGAGEIGQTVARKLLHHPEYGLNLVGFLDRKPTPRDDDLQQVALLGVPEHLSSLVPLLDIERVIIAFSGDSHEHSLELIRSLKDDDVQVDIVPRLFEVVGPRVGLHSVEGMSMVGLPPFRLSRSSALLKRTIDVALSFAGLCALAPAFLVIGLLIKHDSPGPVFFRQLRSGAGDRPFRIYKFRTMSTDAEDRKAGLAHLSKHARVGGDPRMFKIPSDPRTTGFGRALRRYSLDELPQLINVLRGEMSLVGPRPLILEEAQHVRLWARRRIDLKPGITGPWQVLGRTSIPFEEMLRLDYLYVTSWSLLNDLKLIVRTLPALLRKQDAY